MAYDEDLADRVRGLLGGESGIDEQQMFGGLAFLADGRMAVAISGEGGLMARFPKDKTEEMWEEPHTRPFEMSGRQMRGWVRVDPEGVETDDQLEPWVKRGLRLRALAAVQVLTAT